MKIDEKFSNYMALTEIKSIKAYKIWFLLIHKELTQAEISRELGIDTGNVNRTVKLLLEKGLIKSTKQVGISKLYKAVCSLEETKNAI